MHTGLPSCVAMAPLLSLDTSEGSPLWRVGELQVMKSRCLCKHTRQMGNDARSCLGLLPA